MYSQEEPNRENENYDHSKEGFEAIGVSEEEYESALALVEQTCCQIGKTSEDVEFWCENLTKKELALLVKEFKHQAKETELSKKFYEIANGIDTKKPTEDQKNSQLPNEFNNVYDHSSKEVSEATGVEEEYFKEKVGKMAENLEEIQKLSISHWCEIIQNSLTHKEVAMMYAAEIKERMNNPMMNFMSFLGGLGRRR